MKKVLLICSLFSAVGAIAVDAQVRLNRERWITYDLELKNQKYEHEAKRKLLQTEDGQIYKNAEARLNICIDYHIVMGNSDTRSICGKFEKMQEDALKKLQERPEYPEYLSVITKRDYYSIKKRYLSGNVFGMLHKNCSDSEKEAMLAVINSMRELDNAKPSTYRLENTNDIAAIEKEVQEELRAFIQENIKTKEELQAVRELQDAEVEKIERLMNY